MFSRVSCAKAARESTADDVFIIPKQWKYKILGVALSNGSVLSIIWHTQVGPIVAQRTWSSFLRGSRCEHC